MGSLNLVQQPSFMQEQLRRNQIQDGRGTRYSISLPMMECERCGARSRGKFCEYCGSDKSHTFKVEER